MTSENRDARIAELEAQVAGLKAQLSTQVQAMEMVENAPICVQVFDTEGYALYMNPAHQAFLGLPDRAIAYGQFNVLTDPGVASVGQDIFFKRAYAGEVVKVPDWAINMQRFEGSWETTHKKVWLQQVIYPIKDEAGEVRQVVSFHWDITARKEMEAALISAQRHESLALLAGGIAHDFNNLLTGILGNASLARMEPDLSSSIVQSLEELQTSAEQAASLTRQLLAYAGKGRFVVRDVVLSTVVRDMAKMLRLVVPQAANIRILTETNEPIRADEAQIRQVVMNLITNAGDSLPDEGGTITLQTTLIVADEAYLSRAFAGEELPPGPYVSLEVSDTGCGMSKATVEQMFDPFYTTKPSGHGLGLAATLGIVHGHRGAIRVYSEPGQGTTFKLLFPQSTEPLERPVLARRARSARPSATILVVDDEPSVRTFVRRTLEQAHYSVLVARDGQEGIEQLALHPGVDLVILDLTMPRMDGAAAFREMRRLKPEVRVLMVSGYNAQDTTSRFAGKGLAGFLQKPFPADALLDTVASLLRADQRTSIEE